MTSTNNEMDFETLKNGIKAEAETDAQIFVDENGFAFDASAGSGEYEVISVHDYLERQGISYKDLPEDQYHELLEIYSKTITAESEQLLAAN